MTIPSTYRRNTTGGAFTAAKQGGVAIGVTDASTVTDGKPITKLFNVRDNAIEGDLRRSVVKENTGANNGAFNTKKPLTSGTFAYGPTAGEFLIRGLAGTLNGTASTVLQFPGSAGYRKAIHSRVKMYGAKVLTAWRNRGWQPLGVSAQRTNWDESATGVNTDGVLDTLSDTFKLATDNTTDATDDAATPTASVPGELIYRDGSANPIQDEYNARTQN